MPLPLSVNRRDTCSKHGRHLVSVRDMLQCAIYGNFSAPKAQEIIVSRGHTLELIRPADNGRLQVGAPTADSSWTQLGTARHVWTQQTVLLSAVQQQTSSTAPAIAHLVAAGHS